MKKVERKLKMKELYLKYRPKRFEDVIGQNEAVDTLVRKQETNTIPHAILFCGPYGTGKTTLARIVAKELNCNKHDFVEKNTADYRGIDDIRNIRKVMNQAPMYGDVRVWLLDEVHMMTTQAFNALLKPLEDTPKHVYFMLATTEPNKVLHGIKQRCLMINLKPLDDKMIKHLLSVICKKEGIKVRDKVVKKIVLYSNGSAREAVQMLDKVYLLDSEQKQLDSIAKTSVQTQTIDIARKLIDTRTKWRDIAPILKELRNENAESIRRLILSYATSVLLNGDNARAFRMIEAFRDNSFDSDFAAIVAGCYEVIN